MHAFWPQIGGVETVTALLAIALRRNGRDVSVLTHRTDRDSPEVDELERVRIHRVDLFDGIVAGDVDRIAASRRAVRDVVRDERPDLLHVVAAPVTAYFVTSMLRTIRAPVVVASHGFWTPPEPERPAMETGLLERATHVTACSQHTLHAIRAAVPKTVARSSVVLNGLEPGPDDPVPLPPGPARIAAIGRMGHEKGLDVLVTAFAQLLARHPDAQLRLVGGGLMHDALERQVGELGIGHAVEFRGWTGPLGVRAEIDAATMVAMPSSSESFGLVAVEAALRGRPVVASRVGGLPEVIEDGVTGLLVEPGDPQALCAALLELADSPRHAATLGAAGRRRAVTEFSAARMVGAYERLYDRLLSEAAPA